MLVTVIIPCHNQGQFLDQSLKSVFLQTYKCWECLIIDDGSTDNTQHIAEKWTKKDHRFYFYRTTNQGVSNARNFGLSKAKGEWIQFLDADDYLFPSKLSHSIQVYQNDHTINFIATNFRHFTSDVKVTTPPFCFFNNDYLSFEKMLFEWNATFSLPIHTVILKKSLIGTTLFPIGLTAQEDWFFWVAIFKKECVPYLIDEPLVLYRSHLKSRTKSKSIVPDQLKVYDLFRQLLTQQEHFQLSVVLMERYLNKHAFLNDKIREIKNSNSFQAGLMIKKILRRLRLLKIGRKLFSYIRILKKSNV